MNVPQFLIPDVIASGLVLFVFRRNKFFGLILRGSSWLSGFSCFHLDLKVSVQIRTIPDPPREAL
jgi:hypothetical protein